MADHALQEVAIPFNGRVYRIRPTWRVLAAIEATVQQPIRALGMKCLGGALPIGDRGNLPEVSLTEIAGIMVALLRDEKDAPAPDKIGEILVDDGYAPLLLPLGQFLTRAQRGNKEHEREVVEARRAAEAEEAKRKAAEAADQATQSERDKEATPRDGTSDPPQDS